MSDQPKPSPLMSLPLEIQESIFKYLLPQDSYPQYREYPFGAERVFDDEILHDEPVHITRSESAKRPRPRPRAPRWSKKRDRIMAIMRTNKYFYHVVKRMLYTNSPIGIHVHEFGIELHMLRRIVAEPKNTTDASDFLYFGKRFDGMNVPKMWIEIESGRHCSEAKRQKLMFRLNNVLEALEKCTIRQLVISFDITPNSGNDRPSQLKCIHGILVQFQRLHRVKKARIENWWSHMRLYDEEVKRQMRIRLLVTASLLSDCLGSKVIPELSLWKNLGIREGKKSWGTAENAEPW
jgi:hypothetical protein